jgi:hypothetical protein
VIVVALIAICQRIAALCEQLPDAVPDQVEATQVVEAGHRITTHIYGAIKPEQEQHPNFGTEVAPVKLATILRPSKD